MNALGRPSRRRTGTMSSRALRRFEAAEDRRAAKAARRTEIVTPNIPVAWTDRYSLLSKSEQSMARLLFSASQQFGTTFRSRMGPAARVDLDALQRVVLIDVELIKAGAHDADDAMYSITVRL
jgi:hypothetical protein